MFELVGSCLPIQSNIRHFSAERNQAENTIYLMGLACCWDILLPGCPRRRVCWSRVCRQSSSTGSRRWRQGALSTWPRRQCSPPAPACPPSRRRSRSQLLSPLVSDQILAWETETVMAAALHHCCFHSYHPEWFWNHGQWFLMAFCEPLTETEWPHIPLMHLQTERVNPIENIHLPCVYLLKTRKIQTTRYKSIAFNRDDIGACSLQKANVKIFSKRSYSWYLTLLKILIKTRKRVTSRPILQK